MPRTKHLVLEAEEGRTVKSIALKEMRLSRGFFSSLKFQGGILLDGKQAKADERVLAGQVLTAVWEDAKGTILAPCQAAFSIAYRDEWYLILDKPAPLPTLCSARQQGPTLENALYARLNCPDNYVFRPVNRLDKGTSGLMAAAMDAHAQQLLQRQLHTGSFLREYLAVCEGHMPEESGVIDLPIGKGMGVRREVTPDGQKAVTHYRVEREGERRSLLRLWLETGRTHQIRVHLSHLGCPIVGDYLYGQEDERLSGRFALHSCKISFLHPFTGATVRRESPLPNELESLLWEK